MQACKAYYQAGRFVPQGFGKLAEGTRAIITLLDEPPYDAAERLKEFDALCELVDAAADEAMPDIDPIRFDGVAL